MPLRSKASQAVRQMYAEEDQAAFKTRRLEAIHRLDREMKANQRAVNKLLTRFTNQSKASADILVSSYFDAATLPENAWTNFGPVPDDILKMAANWCVAQDRLKAPPATVQLDHSRLHHNLELLNFKRAAQKTKSFESVYRESDLLQRRLIRREVLLLSGQGLEIKNIAKLTRLSNKEVKKVILVAKHVGVVEAIEGTSSYSKNKPKLNSRHQTFIESIVAFHSGETTLKIIRSALIANFSDIGNISLSTISYFMKTQMKLSKKRVSSRNPRILILREDRGVAIKDYAAQLSYYNARNYELINIDESAIILGEAANVIWTRRGETAYSLDKAKTIRRYTLLLSVGKSGFFFGRLIDGSCKAMIYADFVRNLAGKLTGKKYVLLADNATVHHTPKVKYVADSTDSPSIYPPPYYPQGCPVELIFGLVKRSLSAYSDYHTSRAARSDTHSTTLDTINSLRVKFSQSIPYHFI